MATTPAIRFHGPRDIRLEHLPVPSIPLRPGWVRVRPQYCGICGTDLHEYLSGPHLIPPTSHPHPLTQQTLPVTIGHEFSAIVTAVAPDAPAHLHLGARVVVQPTLWDASCAACDAGAVNCCANNGFLGLSGWAGGMARSADVPATAVKKLPDNVPLDVGALVEPLAVGWHAVAASPLQAGQTALVIGGGPIGLAVLQAIAAQAAETQIIVVEPSPRRREFARQFGAGVVLDPAAVGDVAAEVRRLTGGRGADVGFDCAGVQGALDGALGALRARGTLVNVAVWEGGRANLDMQELVFREKVYMGIATYNLGDFEAVIEALADGRLRPEGMITRRVAMDRVVEDGFRALVDDRDSHVKILVDMTRPIPGEEGEDGA